MADLALLTIVALLLAMAWKQPWVGLLGLVFVGILHPQNYVSGFMAGTPIYSLLLATTSLAAAWRFFQRRQWPRPPWDWRLGLLALLWGWFVLSTLFALNPLPAREKLLEVSKLLPPMLLVLLLLDTREKLRWFLLAIGLSVAAIILKGGYWAVITGFQDRVHGPGNSAYGGNNEFAVATTMAIPLLVMWYRGLRHPGARALLGTLVALGFASALSSWSRGGLLSLTAVTVLLLWHSPRKWLAIPLLGLGVILAFAGLPEAWFARMQTLGAPELEGSAASRLAIWRVGWDYALAHPWLGAGFESWVLFTPPDAQFRAWHSAYVQLAAEHGLAGLALWSGLLGATLWQLTRLIGQGRRRGLPWIADQAAALRATLVAYLVGAAFLSIAYWELLYLLLAAALVLGARAREEMAPARP